MKGTYLGELEELVLLTVANLQPDAYGISLQKKLEQSAGRKISLSSVHTVLQRLEKKGFLKSHMGGATPKRGGKRKRFFEVTPAGVESLESVRELREELWKGIPRLAFNKG